MTACKILLVVAVALVLASAAAGAEEESAWDSFKRMFQKVFANQTDEDAHHSAYDQLAEFIERFNRDQAESAGYSLGFNHMSDWTEEEEQLLHGLRLSDDTEESNNSSQLMMAGTGQDSEVPDSFDWRDVEGAVSPVKNQGRCGSCWAYGVTGTMEAHQVRRGVRDTLVPLSEQNLVDCSDKNFGCRGGRPQDGFDDARQMGGVMAERDYPYEGRAGRCRQEEDKAVMTVSGWKQLPVGDEEALKRTIATHGPVSVGMNSSPRTFHAYRKGVYSDRRCRNGLRQGNHVMLAVGYGTDPQQGDYWIIKNSWGADWGEDGYVRIARNKNNMCGVSNYGFVPTFD